MTARAVPGSPRRLVVVPLVVLLAACSLSADEQTAARNLASVIGDRTAPESTQEAASCVAERWVGEAGTEALEEDGLLRRDLKVRQRAVRRLLAGRGMVSEQTAGAYAAAELSCRDHDVIALDQRASHPGASDEDLDEYADCLKEIDRSTLREAIIATLTGDPDAPVVREAGLAEAACSSALAQAAR